jgi:GGDEF domain-containing protein
MVFRRKPKEERPAEVAPSEPGGFAAPAAPAPGPEPPAGAEQALFDPLGMHQLWYLERRLKDELARAARVNSIFSLATWRLRMLPGEEMSNELVQKAAQLISGRLRTYDICARIDDERFAAILFDAEAGAVSTVAFRIKADLQMQAQSAGRWQAGVSTFPTDGVDGDGLIQAAFRRLDEDSRAA